jgi:hypothetical protein
MLENSSLASTTSRLCNQLNRYEDQYHPYGLQHSDHQPQANSEDKLDRAHTRAKNLCAQLKTKSTTLPTRLNVNFLTLNGIRDNLTQERDAIIKENPEIPSLYSLMAFVLSLFYDAFYTKVTEPKKLKKHPANQPPQTRSEVETEATSGLCSALFKKLSSPWKLPENTSSEHPHHQTPKIAWN